MIILAKVAGRLGCYKKSLELLVFHRLSSRMYRSRLPQIVDVDLENIGPRQIVHKRPLGGYFPLEVSVIYAWQNGSSRQPPALVG